MSSADCRTSASLCSATSDGDRWLRAHECACLRECVWGVKRLKETATESGNWELDTTAHIRIQQTTALISACHQNHFWLCCELWYKRNAVKCECEMPWSEKCHRFVVIQFHIHGLIFQQSIQLCFLAGLHLCCYCCLTVKLLDIKFYPRRHPCPLKVSNQ